MIGGCRDGQGLPRCERSRRGFLLSAYGADRSMPDAGRLAMRNRRRGDGQAPSRETVGGSCPMPDAGQCSCMRVQCSCMRVHRLAGAVGCERSGRTAAHGAVRLTTGHAESTAVLCCRRRRFAGWFFCGVLWGYSVVNGGKYR